MANNTDHVFLLFFAHVWEDRQTNQPFPLGRSNRQMVRLQAERFFIIGVQVQRPPMYRTADTVLVQLLDELVAADREPLQTQAAGSASSVAAMPPSPVVIVNRCAAARSIRLQHG